MGTSERRYSNKRTPFHIQFFTRKNLEVKEFVKFYSKNFLLYMVLQKPELYTAMNEAHVCSSVLLVEGMSPFCSGSSVWSVDVGWVGGGASSPSSGQSSLETENTHTIEECFSLALLANEITVKHLLKAPQGVS